MERERNSPIHGSVIQRSLIPEGLGTVLNVATAPIAELDSPSFSLDPRYGFQRLVGQVLGIPAASTIDDAQYRSLAGMLINGEFWEDMAMQADHPYFHRLYHDWYRYWRAVISESDREIRGAAFPDRPAALLASHSLSLMVSPTKHSGMPWPFFVPFPVRRSPRGFRPFGDLMATEEALQLGMDCFFTALMADDRVVRFTSEAGGFDIPSGQSPSARSDSLTKLIETSKKVCLAPLAIGGTAAVSHLSQGSYVAALLCTGTGAAMTLMLVGTVSVADYLVHYLLHKRNSIDDHENRLPRRGR